MKRSLPANLSIPVIGCFAIAMIMSSCGKGRLDVDTSQVTMAPVSFKRLDQDVFRQTPATVGPQAPVLQKKYGAFYSRFIGSIINNGGTSDSLYSENLLRFINDKDMSTVYQDVEKMYPAKDLDALAAELTVAMKRYKALFPDRQTPGQYVTFMSGFNYNIVYVDSTLAVGLEMYLGENYKYYSALQLPRFRTKLMSREYIVPDAVRGMLITEFDNQDAVNNLLNHMIFYGKIFYLCDALLPNVNDSLKFGYTGKQLAYCSNYEHKLWGYFVKDEKLYANDLKVIGEFTNDGPFTGSISKDCPPRIAMWMGRQIVKSYMEHNEKVTFEALMNEKDAQKILSQAKYKP